MYLIYSPSINPHEEGNTDVVYFIGFAVELRIMDKCQCSEHFAFFQHYIKHT